jgi:mono/diheme cytochrome c family protein
MKQFALACALLLAACSAPPPEPPARAASEASSSAPAPPTSTPTAAAPARGHGPEHAHGASTSTPSAGDPVEGRRVARRVGCYGCHGDDLAGKKLWGEPGKFQLWSANITEHIGHYDDAAFERLLRTGKTHHGQRPLGMPILMYQYLSDREVRDITAAMRAAPKVANPKLKRSWMTPAMRKEMEGYGDDRGDPVAAGAPKEPPRAGLALGRHLAMTSCQECHGPDLNGFGGEEAPPLIVAKGYSAEQFRRLMRTGITAQGTESKSGLMSSISRERLAPTLSDADIDAMKAFLDAR